MDKNLKDFEWTDPSEVYAAPVMRDACTCPHLDSILPTILQVQGCGLFAQSAGMTSTVHPTASLIHNLHVQSDSPSSLSSPSSSPSKITYPWGKEQYKFDVVASGGLSDYYCTLIPPRYTQRLESKNNGRKRSSPSSVTEPQGNFKDPTLSWNPSLVVQKQEKLLKMKKPLVSSTSTSSKITTHNTTTTTTTQNNTMIKKPSSIQKQSLVSNPTRHDDDDDSDSIQTTLQEKQILANVSIQVESWMQVLKDNRLRYWQSQHMARWKQKHSLDATLYESSSSPGQSQQPQRGSNSFLNPSSSSLTIPHSTLCCTWCVDQTLPSGTHLSHPYMSFYSSDALMQCLECSIIACGPLAMDVSSSSVCPFLPPSRQHIRQHFLLSGHSLGITCGPLAGIYCMQCGDFIHHEAFENEIQRLDIQQNANSLGWSRNRPLIRSFKYKDFIVTPDLLFGGSPDPVNPGGATSASTVVWRGFRATYPSAESKELILAVYLTFLRMQLFRGDFSIPQYLTLDYSALNMAPLGKHVRVIQKIQAPVGLYNLGNTCFMNSVLQCLVHCDPFQRYFLVDMKHNYMACPHLRKTQSAVNHKVSSVCLGCEMDKAILSVYGAARGLNARGILEASAKTSSLPILSSSSSSTTFESNMKGSPIVISDMLTAVRKCRTMSRLKGHEQHDAHEFLQEFLDSLGKHCRIYTKNLNQLRFEASSSTFESALNDNSILLSSVDMDVSKDTFGGELRSLLICGKCGHKRLQMEPYLNISLPLTKEWILQPGIGNKTPIADESTPYSAKLSLFSCLQHFTTPESLIDPVFCEDCGMKTPTLKQHTFAKLSRVLCFHLKRFDFQTKKKITEPVSFPISLNMGSYLPGWCEVIQGDTDALSDIARMEPREEASVMSVAPVVLYDLHATIEHTGSLNQGHYVSNVKINGKWYNCNDSFVSHVSDETNVMNSENAYMLFYSRRII